VYAGMCGCKSAGLCGRVEIQAHIGMCACGCKYKHMQACGREGMGTCEHVGVGVSVWTHVGGGRACM